MTEVRDIAAKVRSKNAGPFWLTIEIFCGTGDAFETLRKAVSTGAVARLFNAEPEMVKRFDIPSLNVIKFSLPRPAVQGTIADRDMHGAAAANLVAELEI